ncbi:Hypothetical protein PBC10988_39010 [Planctomycetales bacterium 10988]|nr:Hypothetical protein PBC10988_39010 [Planctomycetales bacterium 10988]
MENNHVATKEKRKRQPKKAENFVGSAGSTAAAKPEAVSSHEKPQPKTWRELAADYKSHLPQFLISVVILIAGGIGFYGLSMLANRPSRVIPEKLPPRVQTVEVKPLTGTLDLEVNGIVVPFRDVQVAAEVAGRVTYKSEKCDVGNFVTKGTHLLTVDKTNYEIERDQLQLQVNQAGVEIEELDVEAVNTKKLIELAQRDVELQKREVDRLERLRERGSISESEVEDAERTLIAAETSVRQQQNQLELLETRKARLQQQQALTNRQLDRAVEDVKRAEIKAPLDGVILSEAVEQDSYVQAGTTLFTIEDTSKAEVRCYLRVEDLYWLWRDNTLSDNSKETELDQADELETKTLPVEEAIEEISADYSFPPTEVSVIYELGGQYFEWEGILNRYDGLGLDERTRTIPCRVVVEHPRKVEGRRVDPKTGTRIGPPALLRGMFVNILIHCDPHTQLLVIPERGLQPGRKIWLIRDEVLTVVPVEVAHINEREAYIYSTEVPLEEGDQVVITPLEIVTDQMPVRSQLVVE